MPVISRTVKTACYNVIALGAFFLVTGVACTTDSPPSAPPPVLTSVATPGVTSSAKPTPAPAPKPTPDTYGADVDAKCAATMEHLRHRFTEAERRALMQSEYSAESVAEKEGERRWPTILPSGELAVDRDEFLRRSKNQNELTEAAKDRWEKRHHLTDDEMIAISVEGVHKDWATKLHD